MREYDYNDPSDLVASLKNVNPFAKESDSLPKYDETHACAHEQASAYKQTRAKYLFFSEKHFCVFN